MIFPQSPKVAFWTNCAFPLQCFSENAVYLFTCKTCSKQDTGSATDVCQKLSN